MAAAAHASDFDVPKFPRYPDSVQPAVFLDRDNTIIENDGDLGRPDDVRLVEGVAPGLKTLREAGFHLVVVTNQGGVARGVFNEDDVDAVHQRIAALVDQHARGSGVIDRFYYCPYHPEGTVAEYRREHIWRKPQPGMILQAARDMGIDLSRSWMIGDQERDIQAGRAAGCRTVLVTTDAELARRTSPTAVAHNFGEAVKTILEHARIKPAHAGHSNGEVTPSTPSTPSTPDRAAKNDEVGSLRRAITELAEEIRSERARRADFSLIKLVAGACQLLALTLAILGLLQMSNADAFLKWMVGAGLAQLATITLLVLDLRA